MSNKILILLIGFVMVLMLGMGGGLFLMWNKLSTINVPANANATGQPGQEGTLEPPLGTIYALDTFIVNLADTGGNRYLRITMDLELGIPELEAEIEKRLPQIRDSILMILPSKRFEDISPVEGKIALRDEILKTLNGFLAQGEITNIYFKEFVVQ
ncbi:MAG: flagellar basal body-associated FliL family protein [Deltaproteobacteria bacterium]|nr:flagellar basal body-associated FliL family protein [Deltaproteobacteria bacterium]